MSEIFEGARVRGDVLASVIGRVALWGDLNTDRLQFLEAVTVGQVRITSLGGDGLSIRLTITGSVLQLEELDNIYGTTDPGDTHENYPLILSNSSHGPTHAWIDTTWMTARSDGFNGRYFFVGVSGLVGDSSDYSTGTSQYGDLTNTLSAIYVGTNSGRVDSDGVTQATVTPVPDTRLIQYPTTMQNLEFNAEVLDHTFFGITYNDDGTERRPATQIINLYVENMDILDSMIEAEVRFPDVYGPGDTPFKFDSITVIKQNAMQMTARRTVEFTT